MQYNWNGITPREFEELCRDLLSKMGFTDIQWYGHSGTDKGRDIICHKCESPISGSIRTQTWVVQCKRLTASRISKATILDWLASCEEHNPSNVLLILTHVLSANLRDWLKGISHKYSFDIYVWGEDTLKEHLYKHKTILRKYFPALSKTGKRVVFYEMNSGYMDIACNDIDEAYIRVMNADNYREAVEKAKELIDFIKTNDIVFAKQ